jgi:uncharacterized membrane protein
MVEKKKDDSKMYAFIATFFSIVGFVIALFVWKDDKYVMYYAKHSLVIFVIAVLAGIINSGLVFIPVLGWLIGLALNVLVFILWLVSWVHALSGEMKDIHVVTDFAKKINL